MIPGTLNYGTTGASVSPQFGLLRPARRTSGGPDARARLASLVAGLNDPGETNPFGTATYQATVGGLTDALRSQAQDDAGRAGALGLTSGQALASGAGARSQALASGVRSAAAGAEQSVASSQARRQQLLLSALGLQAQLDEQEQARKAGERNGLLGVLGTLGGAGLGFLLGGPPGAVAGGTVGGNIA